MQGLGRGYDCRGCASATNNICFVCHSVFGIARFTACQWRPRTSQITLFSLHLFPFFPSSYYFLLSKIWVVPFPPLSPQLLLSLVPSNLTMRCTHTILAGPTRIHGIPTRTLFSRMRSTRHPSLLFPWNPSPQSRAAMAPLSTRAAAPRQPSCLPFPGRSRPQIRTWSYGSRARPPGATQQPPSSTDFLPSPPRAVTRPPNCEASWRSRTSCPLRHLSDSTPANSIARAEAAAARSVSRRW